MSIGATCKSLDDHPADDPVTGILAVAPVDSKRSKTTTATIKTIRFF
ncbi:hypothetical protein OpiT1DRAFT_02974 [Opitutaceae bacterium TAV1]|nr:hypothetical protein OpiT1DRAFT_02974 [Opitutaceae bacterium TAV1]